VKNWVRNFIIRKASGRDARAANPFLLMAFARADGKGRDAATGGKRVAASPSGA
jgi:hypothetical protein